MGHGKKDRHSSRKRKCSRGDHSAEPVGGSKLLRCASLGKTRKLRSLLADVGDTAELLSRVTDSAGATALHAAARHGQLDAALLLLRRGADSAAQDAAGNTPGHLAAMHGHLLVLTELVKAAGIDLDLPNAAGFTIRQIVQQQQQAGSQAAAGTRSGTGSPTSSYNSEEAAAAKAAAGAAATSARTRAAKPGVGLHKDEEDDWLDKLAFEMSYDDGGGFHGAWGDAMAAAAEAEAWEGPGRSPTHRGSSKHRRAPSYPRDPYADDDEDDTWADRLWQDMQEHKRQAAMAAAAAAAARSGRPSSTGLFSPGSSRAEAARERERKAAAAAAESARILKEEQAKDADWRAAMMRQVEEASLPLRRSTYEACWQKFESWPAGKLITFQDVPWPCPTPGSQAAARKQQQQQQVLELDQKQLQTMVLAGAKSATDIKLALRKELMRWHPDKFTARYGAKLAPADKDAIQAGVHAVAQHLTALKQQ